MENNSDISKTLGIDSSPSRSRRLARWLGWSLPLIAGAVLAAGWLSNDGADTVQYTTQPAVRDSLTVTVTATGNLEPTNEVEVGSELSGTVKTVEVDYNDHVKTGQVLARLDTSKLQAQVMQSKASLAAAQAKVLDARATIKEAKSELARLEHLRGLSGEKAVSRHDMDAAEATLARAVAGQSYYEAEVSRTKAVLEANETDLSKAVIRSTVNGIVLNRSVEPGQTVAASLETPVLFKLAEDLSKMKLHVSVDEADVGDVRDGQEATFAVDAYRGRRFPAHITQVRYGPEEDEDESSDDDGVVTYIAVLNVDNSDLSLRPGMTATAEIVVQKLEGAVLVPNAALRFSPPEEVKQTGSQKSGIMSKLLPRPPAPTQSNKTEQQNDADRRARVWTLRDGLPAPISVKTGSTDGTRTVILEGAVEPGTALIVDRVSATP
jgi:HlyD family secretion protein